MRYKNNKVLQLWALSISTLPLTVLLPLKLSPFGIKAPKRRATDPAVAARRGSGPGHRRRRRRRTESPR